MEEGGKDSSSTMTDNDGGASSFMVIAAVGVVEQVVEHAVVADVVAVVAMADELVATGWGMGVAVEIDKSAMMQTAAPVFRGDGAAV